MLVQFLCRYQKSLDPKIIKEIDAELEILSVITKDFDRELEKEKLVKEKSGNSFEYGPILINLKDICVHNSVDEEHTCLRLYNGSLYVVKVPWIYYISIYQTLVGVNINDFTTLDNIKTTLNG